MKKLTTTAALFALFSAAIYAAPPPIVHTTESDWQQTQQLDTLEVQQGAGVRLHERLTTGGKYLDLTGLTARWEAQQHDQHAGTIASQHAYADQQHAALLSI